MKSFRSVIGILLLFSCGMKLKSLESKKETVAMPPVEMRVNQLGYEPQSSKKLVLLQANADQRVEIKVKGGELAFSGQTKHSKTWLPSGELASVFDFSNLKTEGVYEVYYKGEKLPGEIKILRQPYGELFKRSLHWFYLQRASIEIKKEFAGVYARPAGHLDQEVFFHKELKKDGILSAPGGWYDAGDYGKYITNSGITVYTLLQLFEMQAKEIASMRFEIPHSELPDYLEEVKYNLDWMLKMQDDDGGIFHKLTTKSFPGTVMPNKDMDQRFVIGKSVTASLNYAATMAYASKIYKPYDEVFSNKLLSSSRRAYQWGKENPKAFFVQPVDVQSGPYRDENADDELLWASVELYLATGEELYLTQSEALEFSSELPWWGKVDGLAVYSILNHQGAVVESLKEKAQKALETLGEKILFEQNRGSYPNGMTEKEFVWGSNSAAANQGIALWQLFKETGREEYRIAVQNNFDYLLGVNPLNKSFVTGFGQNTPLDPHHRPSGADEIAEPIPGMLVGGPHLGGQDVGDAMWQCQEYRKLPANSYIDSHCSYATNEVAINWNAPLVFLAGVLSNYYSAKP